MDALTRNMPSVELNNVAVALVQSGRTQEAMELFQIGLAILRDQFHGAHETLNLPMEGETNAVHSGGDPDVSGPSNHLRCAVNISASDPVEMSLDSTTFLAVYDRALVVDWEGTDATPPLDDTRLTAVILFNMALLHHARGLRDSIGDSLDRARRLYWFAIGILQMYHATPTSSNDLLWLALYNNVAHIDSYRFRIQEMKDSLEQVRNLLRPLHGDDDNVSVSIDEEDYNIFAVNALYGRETSFRVAPAA